MNVNRKLFGTDGVRGVAGEQLTAELALALGRAATAVCPAARPQVLIVRDTRESGPMLESGLAAGIAEAGGDALCAGVIPTPAASILVRRLGLDLAAVVSASHNPWQDNGIKFFGADGRKLAGEARGGDRGARRADRRRRLVRRRRRDRTGPRARGRARRLPARARANVSARPLGTADRPRLRQRLHLSSRAGDLRQARRRRRGDRRGARRAEHQPWLRIDRSRGA